ncbi:hypothetical protein FDP41_005484 [Naegleria fowleri]|uniref:Uncharacterized protein n=1 Tax=Naegleria fowleri TaxID=5763 RepID=A0A6A5BNE5_NAEFO|nr:uncharacterized protein FDP41_005484 [Naegleria fowleri]KAF0975490.1 hypothetical protein FDP41_005484 [Naegleria fowleri]CAG4708508.1 unnamed protein product [Naegleria fowleri]
MSSSFSSFSLLLLSEVLNSSNEWFRKVFLSLLGQFERKMIVRTNRESNHTMTTQQLSPTLITQILILISSILTGGFRYYHSIMNSDHALMMNQELENDSSGGGGNSITSTTTTTTTLSTFSLKNPFFGERPHYFMPPSDMEQYRRRGRQSQTGSSTQELSHVYIPYPNDPPHTFPSIKARSLFTKSPNKLSQVYIERIDPVNRSNLRSGAKLKVPLQQLEERFRTVYTNAKDNGLEITMNVKKNLNSQEQFEKLGFYQQQETTTSSSSQSGGGSSGGGVGTSGTSTPTSMESVNTTNSSNHLTYDFHHVDGLITPPLYRLE